MTNEIDNDDKSSLILCGNAEIAGCAFDLAKQKGIESRLESNIEKVLLGDGRACDLLLCVCDNASIGTMVSSMRIDELKKGFVGKYIIHNVDDERTGWKFKTQKKEALFALTTEFAAVIEKRQHYDISCRRAKVCLWICVAQEHEADARIVIDHMISTIAHTPNVLYQYVFEGDCLFRYIDDVCCVFDVERAGYRILDSPGKLDTTSETFGIETARHIEDRMLFMHDVNKSFGESSRYVHYSYRVCGQVGPYGETDEIILIRVMSDGRLAEFRALGGQRRWGFVGVGRSFIRISVEEAFRLIEKLLVENGHIDFLGEDDVFDKSAAYYWNGRKLYRFKEREVEDADESNPGHKRKEKYCEKFRVESFRLSHDNQKNCSVDEVSPESVVRWRCFDEEYLPSNCLPEGIWRPDEYLKEYFSICDSTSAKDFAVRICMVSFLREMYYHWEVCDDEGSRYTRQPDLRFYLEEHESDRDHLAQTLWAVDASGLAYKAGQWYEVEDSSGYDDAYRRGMRFVGLNAHHANQYVQSIGYQEALGILSRSVLKRDAPLDAVNGKLVHELVSYRCDLRYYIDKENRRVVARTRKFDYYLWNAGTNGFDEQVEVNTRQLHRISEHEFNVVLKVLSLEQDPSGSAGQVTWMERCVACDDVETVFAYFCSMDKDDKSLYVCLPRGCVFRFAYEVEKDTIRATLKRTKLTVDELLPLHHHDASIRRKLLAARAEDEKRQNIVTRLRTEERVREAQREYMDDDWRDAEYDHPYYVDDCPVYDAVDEEDAEMLYWNTH